MFVISTDYLSWMFNGIRQFIAVCIVLLSFGLVLRKKYIPAILIILLAATIHASALMMLPLAFVIQGRSWNWKTLILLAGVGAAILLIDPFTSFVDSILAETQYSDLITNDIWKNDNGTNALRALFYSIPAILSLIGKRFVDRERSPIINLCVNCGICTADLYDPTRICGGALAHRPYVHKAICQNCYRRLDLRLSGFFLLPDACRLEHSLTRK